VDRRAEIAFDVDDLVVGGPDDRVAADRAIGTDAGIRLGVLESERLRPDDGGPQVGAERREAAKRRAAGAEAEKAPPREDNPVHADLLGELRRRPASADRARPRGAARRTRTTPGLLRCYHPAPLRQVGSPVPAAWDESAPQFRPARRS